MNYFYSNKNLCEENDFGKYDKIIIRKTEQDCTI